MRPIFTLEAKVTNSVLGLSFMIMKDSRTGTFEVRLRGCTVFKGDDRSLLKSAIKDYHREDYCGLFLSHKHGA